MQRLQLFMEWAGICFTLKLNDKQYSPLNLNWGIMKIPARFLLGHLGLKEKSKIEIDHDLGAGWGFNCVVTKLDCEDEPPC